MPTINNFAAAICFYVIGSNPMFLHQLWSKTGSAWRAPAEWEIVITKVQGRYLTTGPSWSAISRTMNRQRLSETGHDARPSLWTIYSDNVISFAFARLYSYIYEKNTTVLSVTTCRVEWHRINAVVAGLVESVGLVAAETPHQFRTMY